MLHGLCAIVTQTLPHHASALSVMGQLFIAEPTNATMTSKSKPPPIAIPPLVSPESPHAFQLRHILDTSPDGILVIDHTTIVRYANPMAHTLLGRGVLVGQPFGYPIISGESAEVDVVSGHGTTVVELRQIETTWDDIPAMIISLRDITERKRMEAALQQTNGELKRWLYQLEIYNRDITMLNRMGEALQQCQTLSDTYHLILRTAPSLFVGQSGSVYTINPTTILLEPSVTWGALAPPNPTAIPPDTCRALRYRCTQVIYHANHGPCCPHVQHDRFVPAICVPLMAQNEQMGILNLYTSETITIHECERWSNLAMMLGTHLALTLRNLSLQDQLRQEAIRDPLTGLFNRRHLDQALTAEVHRAIRHTYPLSIIMLDIDHFKQFNDTYGHAAGDAVLREVGRFLQTHTRNHDTACRYGGEEFLLILPTATGSDAYRRAEQLRHGIQSLTLDYEQERLRPITISLGIATFPTCATTPEALISAADTALYLAKRQGRNCVSCATPTYES